MKIPTIKWTQNDNYIFIDVHLEPSDKVVYNIDDTFLSFKQDDYEFKLEFFNPICIEECKLKTTRIYEFYLKKKDIDNEWKQLLKDKTAYKLLVNWDKFDIEDDEIPDDGMPDMSSMMGGMGGMPDMSSMMGGMGGMPDMSSMMDGMGGMPDMSSMMGGMNECCEDEFCKNCNDSEEVDSEEVDSEEVDSEEVDSEEVDSEEVDSEEVDNENVGDEKKVDSEEVDSEEVDNTKINDENIKKD